VWLVDHVARGSLREAEGGWTWWFDPDLWAKLTYQRRDPEAAAAALGCRWPSSGASAQIS